ncbi:D-2-hydroxyacid dehydrogenase [Evansella clarkii]|uniref:D-2-hydroxyacid dehydrogenase n=1 Tax=Evansella clarkii TaxID=79879 RepID=UPI0009985276
MVQKKVIITHNISENLIEETKKAAPGWEIITGKNEDIWLPHINDAAVIAGWKKEMNEHLKIKDGKLRWLQTWSAGINSLPLKELENEKTLLTNATGVHAYPISETIFALMLGLTRKVHTYVRNQQEKLWHHANMGMEMHGKTLGVIGVGAIGKETAKIAKAFNMTVIGIRNSEKQEENVDEMYTMDKLNEILPRCDYVAVTLPLTEQTNRLFKAEQFKLMKESAFFVNIGRGQLVVEEDLIKALKNGEIAGAGLDVFEQEPLEETSPLWDMENVIVTPHTAGSTEYYNQRLMEDIFIPNLKNFAEGKLPGINLIDYRRGY